MIRKFIKTGISLALAFSLAMLPISNVFSKTIADLQQSQMASASTLASLAIDATNYDEVKKLAEIKASILTSIYGVTSIQYALIDNGEIVLSGHSGVYSKEETTALTENSMYGIGSISKMYTSVAVMQLVEQGNVKLDNPVIKYLPEFKMADARYKDITVRMLLNHSSGLMGSTFSNSMLFDDNDSTNYKSSLLNELKTSRLKADPGEFSVYCNDGFTLAELLVEKVTGISFTDYIGKNISDPLGMVNTKTPKDDFQRNLLAKTYLSIVLGSLSTQIIIPKELEGYCNNAAIIDKNTARTLIQIPGLYGRDLSDYTFYNIGETEYLKVSGSIAISENAIKSLSTKSAFTCKISADGYAHWYKISKKSENKKVKIVLPKNSSFSVYDAKGTCVNYSFLSKQDTVTLPANGFIVFVGNANASFAVRYVK